MAEVVLEPVDAGHLVLALGSGNDMSVVPGMMEHAFFLRTLADAMELRGHIIRRLEEALVESDPVRRARLLNFVVVGGGFSGVEVAGQMLDLFATAVRFYAELRESAPKVTLIHSGQALLPDLDEELGQAAQKSLQKRGLIVRTGCRVSAITAETVCLQGGEELETGSVVCTIGSSPHPVLKDLAVEKVRGRVATDEFLRLKGHENVWAVGDGAACPDGFGGICPPTGQYATRLGKHLADNIHAALAERPLVPFKHASVGQVATIGHHNGVCKVKGWRFTGFFAWWMARTIHLLLLPGLEQKVRMVLDWTLDLFFTRDLNYLDLSKTETVAHVYLEPNDVLFRQGDRSYTFYIVEKGLMELTRRDEQGNVLLSELLRAGDHFGEGSLLRKSSRSTTAVAKEPTRLLALGPRDFQTLVSSSVVLKRSLEQSSYRFRPVEELTSFHWPETLLVRPVASIMTQPVDTLRDDATIGDAFRFITDRRRGEIPLVDANGHLTGIVTRTDMYRVLSENIPLENPVQSIAVKDVLTLTAAQTIRDALALFRRRQLRHVPVVDADRKPIGMLSYIDVANAILKVKHSPCDPSGCCS
jgi:NADH dehydrogenase